MFSRYLVLRFFLIFIFSPFYIYRGECRNKMELVESVHLANLVNRFENCYIRINLFGKLNIKFATINKPIVIYNFENLTPIKTNYNKNKFYLYKILQKFQPTYDFTLHIVPSTSSIMRLNNLLEPKEYRTGFFSTNYDKWLTQHRTKIDNIRLTSCIGFVLTEKQFQNQIRFKITNPSTSDEAKLHKFWNEKYHKDFENDSEKTAKEFWSTQQPFLLFFKFNVQLQFSQHIFFFTFDKSEFSKEGIYFFTEKVIYICIPCSFTEIEFQNFKLETKNLSNLSSTKNNNTFKGLSIFEIARQNEKKFKFLDHYATSFYNSFCMNEFFKYPVDNPRKMLAIIKSNPVIDFSTVISLLLLQNNSLSSKDCSTPKQKIKNYLYYFKSYPVFKFSIDTLVGPKGSIVTFNKETKETSSKLSRLASYEFATKPHRVMKKYSYSFLTCSPMVIDSVLADRAMNNFLKPMDTSVWIAVFVLIIVLILYLFVSNNSLRSFKNIYVPFELFYIMFGWFLEISVVIRSQVISLKHFNLIFGIVILLGIILSNGYKGIVTNDMLVPLPPKTPENFTELQKSDTRLLLVNGSQGTTPFDDVDKYGLLIGIGKWRKYVQDMFFFSSKKHLTDEYDYLFSKSKWYIDKQSIFIVSYLPHKFTCIGEFCTTNLTNEETEKVRTGFPKVEKMLSHYLIRKSEFINISTIVSTISECNNTALVAQTHRIIKFKNVLLGQRSHVLRFPYYISKYAIFETMEVVTFKNGELIVKKLELLLQSGICSMWQDLLEMSEILGVYQKMNEFHPQSLSVYILAIFYILGFCLIISILVFLFELRKVIVTLIKSVLRCLKRAVRNSFISRLWFIYCVPSKML